MSKIIEKTFDASKKIIRSIFKGTPNLLTATDLNRQIAALKYQIDKVESGEGVTSQLVVSAHLNAKTDEALNIFEGQEYVTVTFNGADINVRGCTFSPKYPEFRMDAKDMYDKEWYIHLIAKKKVVAYEDDFSHEISGARFEDGTSMAAANNEVYYDEEVVVTSDKKVDNCVLTLGRFIVPKGWNLDELKVPLSVSKYWKTSPDTFDFQKVVKNPIEKFGTPDMAIGTLALALQSLGNHVYTGKCTCGGEACGTWKVVLLGKLLYCYVDITKCSAALAKGRRVDLQNFKWQFVTSPIPVDFRLDVSVIDPDAVETFHLRDTDFTRAVFRPHSIVTLPDNDNATFDKTPYLSYDNSILGFEYTGKKTLKEEAIPSDISGTGNFMCFTFSAIVWNHGKNSVHPKEMDL